MTIKATCVSEVHVTLSNTQHVWPLVCQYAVKLRYRAQPTVHCGLQLYCEDTPYWTKG